MDDQNPVTASAERAGKLYDSWLAELCARDLDARRIAEIEKTAALESVDLFGSLEDDMRRVDGALVAATRHKWNPDLHPRGKDGRFINKLGFVKFLFNALKDIADIEPSGRNKEVRGQVVDIRPNPDTPGDPDIVIRVNRPEGFKDIIKKASELETAPRQKASLNLAPERVVDPGSPDEVRRRLDLMQADVDPKNFVRSPTLDQQNIATLNRYDGYDLSQLDTQELSKVNNAQRRLAALYPEGLEGADAGRLQSERTRLDAEIDRRRADLDAGVPSGVDDVQSPGMTPDPDAPDRSGTTTADVLKINDPEELQEIADDPTTPSDVADLAARRSRGMAAVDAANAGTADDVDDDDVDLSYLQDLSDSDLQREVNELPSGPVRDAALEELDARGMVLDDEDDDFDRQAEAFSHYLSRGMDEDDARNLAAMEVDLYDELRADGVDEADARNMARMEVGGTDDTDIPDAAEVLDTGAEPERATDITANMRGLANGSTNMSDLSDDQLRSIVEALENDDDDFADLGGPTVTNQIYEDALDEIDTRGIEPTPMLPESPGTGTPFDRFDEHLDVIDTLDEEEFGDFIADVGYAEEILKDPDSSPDDLRVAAQTLEEAAVGYDDTEGLDDDLAPTARAMSQALLDEANLRVEGRSSLDTGEGDLDITDTPGMQALRNPASTDADTDAERLLDASNAFRSGEMDMNEIEDDELRSLVDEADRFLDARPDDPDADNVSRMRDIAEATLTDRGAGTPSSTPAPTGADNAAKRQLAEDFVMNEDADFGDYTDAELRDMYDGFQSIIDDPEIDDETKETAEYIIGNLAEELDEDLTTTPAVQALQNRGNMDLVELAEIADEVNRGDNPVDTMGDVEIRERLDTVERAKADASYENLDSALRDDIESYEGQLREAIGAVDGSEGDFGATGDVDGVRNVDDYDGLVDRDLDLTDTPAMQALSEDLSDIRNIPLEDLEALREARPELADQINAEINARFTRTDAGEGATGIPDDFTGVRDGVEYFEGSPVTDVTPAAPVAPTYPSRPSADTDWIPPVYPQPSARWNQSVAPEMQIADLPTGSEVWVGEKPRRVGKPFFLEGQEETPENFRAKWWDGQQWDYVQGDTTFKVAHIPEDKKVAPAARKYLTDTDAPAAPETSDDGLIDRDLDLADTPAVQALTNAPDVPSVDADPTPDEADGANLDAPPPPDAPDLPADVFGKGLDGTELRAGTRVTSVKDGFEGEVVSIPNQEKYPGYVYIRSDDGTKKLRSMKTLKTPGSTAVGTEGPSKNPAAGAQAVPDAPAADRPEAPDAPGVQIPEGWNELPQSVFQRQQNIHTYENAAGQRVGYAPMTGWVVHDSNGGTLANPGFGDKGRDAAFGFNAPAADAPDTWTAPAGAPASITTAREILAMGAESLQLGDNNTLETRLKNLEQHGWPGDAYTLARDDSPYAWPSWMPKDERDVLAEAASALKQDFTTRATDARNRVDMDLRESGNGNYTASALLDRIKEAYDQERGLGDYRLRWAQPGEFITIKPPSGYEVSISAQDAQALILGSQIGLV